MVHEIAKFFIRDICYFLDKNRDYFKERNEDDVNALFADFPSIKSYFSKVNEEKFLSEVSEFTEVLNKKHDYNISENNLFLSFLEFLVKDFELIDKEKADDSLSLYGAIKNIKQYYTEKEIADAILSFVGNFFEIPYIVIQTPVKLDQNQKVKIKDDLLKTYKYAYPIFIVNPMLIGGMRVLIDGNMKDYSWYGLTANITNLLTRN